MSWRPARPAKDLRIFNDFLMKISAELMQSSLGSWPFGEHHIQGNECFLPSSYVHVKKMCMCISKSFLDIPCAIG